jgi:hypothetical protein
VRGSRRGEVEFFFKLNRRIMHQQIIERDPALFEETSLEQFPVVAPGGRIENKMEAVGGVPSGSVAIPACT